MRTFWNFSLLQVLTFWASFKFLQATGQVWVAKEGKPWPGGQMPATPLKRSLGLSFAVHSWNSRRVLFKRFPFTCHLTRVVVMDAHAGTRTIDQDRREREREARVVFARECAPNPKFCDYNVFLCVWLSCCCCFCAHCLGQHQSTGSGEHGPTTPLGGGAPPQGAGHVCRTGFQDRPAHRGPPCPGHTLPSHSG